MKTTKLCSLIIGVFIFYNAYSDIIDPNEHYVENCITITNLDEYPDVVLLGYLTGYWGGKFSYRIMESECLYKDNPYNEFKIYAVPADYLTGKDIETMDLPNDPVAIKANVRFDPWRFICPGNSPLKKVEQYGKIMGFTDSTVVLFEWKEVMQYYGNWPDSVRYFEYDGDTSALSQEFPNIIQVPEYNEEIKLYPNPGTGYLNLKMNNEFLGEVSVKIFSLNGQVSGSFTGNKVSNNNHFTISLDNLIPGTYVIRIQYGNRIESRKIIVN